MPRINIKRPKSPEYALILAAGIPKERILLIQPTIVKQERFHNPTNDPVLSPNLTNDFIKCIGFNYRTNLARLTVITKKSRVEKRWIFK